jgi:hypothetical protein
MRLLGGGDDVHLDNAPDRPIGGFKSFAEEYIPSH